MKHSIAHDVAALDAGRTRLAHEIATIAGEAADLLKDASGDNLRRAQEALAAVRSAIRSGGGDALDVTGEYVSDHPWRAIGVAALVGLLAGAVLARR